MKTKYRKLLIASLFPLISIPLFPQAKWDSVSELPVYTDRAVAFSIGDYGYVGTGVSQSKPINRFWRYDPIMNNWIEIDSMPTYGRYGAISFSIGNKGYVGGGQKPDTFSVDDFWEYDPETSSWTQKSSLPYFLFPDNSLTAFSIGERGYVLFGARNFDNFFLYYPVDDHWYKRAMFPGNAIMFWTSFSIGNKGYIASGFGHHTSEEFWEYDPDLDTWTRMANFPSPRIQSVSFVLDGKAYVGMGSQPGNLYLSDFYEYNPEKDEWSMSVSIPYVAWDPIAITIGSKGYVGTGALFCDCPNFWVFDPGTNSVPINEVSNIIYIYPNPTGDILNIKLDNSNTVDCEIYSIMGQLILQAKIVNGQVNIESLRPGQYFLIIKLDKQKNELFKFVKL